MIKTERTKNTSRNIIWGFCNKVVTLGMPFITRTVMIYTLGMDYVGLGSLFMAILQVLSFAELGIGGALVFSMYKPVAEGDDDKVSALLCLYKKIYRVIGLIILLAGLAVMPFLKHLVAGSIPSGINLSSLFIIYLANNLIGYFLFAYKQSLFLATQRVDIISRIGMLLQLISSTSQIIILLTIRNYYAYAIVVPAITLLNNVLLGYMSDKKFPQYKSHGTINKEEREQIKQKVGGMLFQKIGNIVLQSVDTIVISSFLGLKVLGVFNGYHYIITALFGFFTVIQQSMIPSIGNCAVVDSIDKNLRDFKKFQFIYIWIVIWCCACLAGLYQPFIKLWQGIENMLSNEIVLLFVIYFFVYKMGDINWMYREAMGLWWEARYIPFISSIVNLIVNVVLVNTAGLPGILISTIVALTLVNLPWSSKVLFVSYFRSKKEWWRYMTKIGIYFIQMIFIILVTWKCCALISENGVLNLVVRSIICLIVPNLLLLLMSIRSKEFKPAGQVVLKVIPKKIIPAFIKRYFTC